MNILQAIDDPQLFKPWLRGDLASWVPWRAFLAALFGLPMSAEQAAIFRQCTGRVTLPTHEGWLICGRRAGKSFIMSLIAVFIAAYSD